MDTVGEEWSGTDGESGINVYTCVLVVQSCLTLRDTMYCGPPGFSVHGILQARMLEWVAMPPPGELPHLGI